MSKADCTLSQEFVKSILDYNSETGEWFWKTKLKAGGKCSQGYWRIKIDQKSYKAHRLAWLYAFGKFPQSQIDHVNGNRSDNRLCNLRLASNAENQMNRAKAAVTNNSGFLGVNFNKVVGKFAARIQSNGKRIHIGYFDSPEDASSAYIAKKTELSSFFNPQRA
jgi:hypothetical protein